MIIQPSPAHDTSSMGAFPAPHMVPEAYIQKHLKSKFHFVADPAVVNISGINIALSGSEVTLFIFSEFSFVRLFPILAKPSIMWQVKMRRK